ncbi:MAG: thioredoxin domain-containing protein [Acidobacteria bacterium]|nr:thioredoxin domain-containing protein [Acidobacteriota bacterium]
MKDEHEIIRLARPVGESDHVLGPPSAVATLVEYGDYECPYCRQLHPMLKELMSRVEGLRFVYRHFPLRNVHPYAVRAAEAAEAASAQGRFWEMHNLLFEQDRPLDDERLSHLARKAGLQMERYAREMADGMYSGKVEEDFNSALFKDGVTGTPTLYINGVQLSNIQSLEALLQAVTEAGATLQPASQERANWLTRLRKFRLGMTRLREH